MLLLRHHGGHCCGRKHISSFQMSLKGLEPEIPKTPSESWINIHAGQKASLIPGSPAESCEERFYRTMDYVRSVWPSRSGMPGSGVVVEATLVKRVWGPDPEDKKHLKYLTEVEMWGPVLESVGFKPVYEFVNRNSGTTVVVYFCNSADIPDLKGKYKALKGANSLR